jgi:hypothetical protein
MLAIFKWDRRSNEEQMGLPTMGMPIRPTRSIFDWEDDFDDDDEIDIVRRSAANRKSRKRRILNINLVLEWADAHRVRTGQWPTVYSGKVDEDPRESWEMINQSLLRGHRGFPGGFTLPQLLFQARGARNRGQRPQVGIRKILQWADAHFLRHGAWPNKRSGPVPELGGVAWATVFEWLGYGKRGLSARQSFNRFLAQRRVPRTVRKPTDFTIAQILQWADKHFAIHGQLPNAKSRGIRHGRDVSWRQIDQALLLGTRGLPGGKSLESLLAEERPGIKDSKIVTEPAFKKRRRRSGEQSAPDGRAREFGL